MDLLGKWEGRGWGRDSCESFESLEPHPAYGHAHLPPSFLPVLSHLVATAVFSTVVESTTEPLTEEDCVCGGACVQ